MPNQLILFGAGASYGSDIKGTPPLGEKLFNALGTFNPEGWGALPHNIEQVFRDDFEAGMLNLSKINPHGMPPLQRAMAMYFFNFRPKTSNLYIELARRIQQSEWMGALVTLNYERMLEISLVHVGIRPVINKEPEKTIEIELCLPHGCCHLFCQSVRGRAGNVSISGTAVQTNGPVAPIGDPSQFHNRIFSDAFPPVMSYFEPHKRTLSGASFIKNQRARWEVLAHEVSTVGLIGIRVRPEDDHIWGPLAKTNAKLVYCSGPQGATEFKEWAASIRPSNKDLVICNYFSNAFDKLCQELKITE